MCRQIQAKSKIVKMAWHIMACVIESKQICGFCGHKKSRPSQEGADGSCRRCTWSEQASRSFEAWVISRLRTFLMFLCTVCTSIQINHHHDYLFSLFCESMCALVYTYVYIYIYRERESLSLESGTCTACTYEPISARMQTCDSHTWMIMDVCGTFWWHVENEHFTSSASTRTTRGWAYMSHHVAPCLGRFHGQFVPNT